MQIGLFRVPVPNYEKDAFREGFVNALVHRDYFRVGAVQVQLQKNALTITSPGGFLEGITPDNNGEVIRLVMPPLTEERRRSLVKQSKQESENAKISIRNARRDAIDALKKSIKAEGVPEDVEKDAEAEVQKIHDKYIKKVDELFAAKEKEIMTV